jgi:hypothetical protein
MIRWSGAAGMLGGMLWIGSAISTAAKPVGCVADACSLPGRSMRESSALDGILFIAALTLFMAGAAGLLLRARSTGRFGRTGRAALAIAVTGITLIVVAGLAQEIFFDGDFPLMPFFIIPGVLALIAGFALTGIHIMRTNVLPRWAGAALTVGASAMLVFNDQDARVLMAIPLGLAWIAVGYVLWSERGADAAPSDASSARLAG